MEDDNDLGMKTLAWCCIICAIIGNIIVLPWSEIFAGQHSLLNVVGNFLVVGFGSAIAGVPLAMAIETIQEIRNGINDWDD